MKDKDIFIVIEEYTDYQNYAIHGIFETKEKALEYMSTKPESYIGFGEANLILGEDYEVK